MCASSSPHRATSQPPDRVVSSRSGFTFVELLLVLALLLIAAGLVFPAVLRLMGGGVGCGFCRMGTAVDALGSTRSTGSTSTMDWGMLAQAVIANAQPRAHAFRKYFFAPVPVTRVMLDSVFNFPLRARKKFAAQ